MKKFKIPAKSCKQAYPRAQYNGQTVHVIGESRKDKYRHTYYAVKPVHKRLTPKCEVMEVRADALDVIG